MMNYLRGLIQNMKTAIIGNGKTGSEIVKLLPHQEIVAIFDIDHPVTVAALKTADVVIVFIPGDQVANIIPILLEAKILAVFGSTGFSWAEDLNTKLIEKKIAWVKAANFSLSMNLIRHCLKILGSAKDLVKVEKFSIHEVHHAMKKDKPSGTALDWQKWLGVACDISSERIGDVKGMHELTIKTSDETITLKHEVHNRALFAKGAIWAANYLYNNRAKLAPGIHEFSDIVDLALGEPLCKI